MSAPPMQSYILVPQYPSLEETKIDENAPSLVSPPKPFPKHLSSKFAPYDANTLVTHVNSAELGLLGGKATSNSERGKSSRRRRKGTTSEKSTSIGNEVAPPWLKAPSSRDVEINTVETLPVVIFLATSAAVPSFASILFTASQIPDFTSFSAIFDQYRIRMIEVLIEPQINEVLTIANDVGELASVVDIDDANVPTAYNDLMSYPSVVQMRGSQSHYHRFVPSIAVATYSGAFTSFAASTSMWLDCGSSSIQHYGIKAGAPTVANVQSYFYSAKLHMSWRARH